MPKNAPGVTTIIFADGDLPTLYLILQSSGKFPAGALSLEWMAPRLPKLPAAERT